MKPITVDQVMKVYSGKPDTCCCGCSGTYRVNSQHLAMANANRGYDYNEPGDVNDKQVRKVVNLINQNLGAAKINEICASVVIKGRLYNAYFVV